MTGSLDPKLMNAENERMEQVLRLLEGFVHRPAAAIRIIRPSLAIEGEAAGGEPPAASGTPGAGPWE